MSVYSYSTVFGWLVRKTADGRWGVFAPGDDPRGEPVARSDWWYAAVRYALEQR